MDMDIVVETTESQSRPDDHDHDHPDEPVDPIWTSSRTARQIYALGEVEKVRRCSLKLAKGSWLTRKCMSGHWQTPRPRSILHLPTRPPTDRSTREQPPARGGTLRAIRDGGERVLRASRRTCFLHLFSSTQLTYILTYPISTQYTFQQQIHISMRSTLAHIRQSRIAPSAINAPPPNFIPQSAGVGTPNLNLDTHANTSNTSNTNTDSSSSGDASGDKAPVNGVVDELGKRGLQEERVHRDAWRGILDALTRLKEARTKSEFSE